MQRYNRILARVLVLNFTETDSLLPSLRPDFHLTDLSPADPTGDGLAGSQQKRLPHRWTV